jgi:uncharacterized Zn-finger protein
MSANPPEHPLSPYASASQPSPFEHGRVAPEPPEVVIVDEHRVWCDGLGGALGHPRVYLEMGAKGYVECGYCDRRFVLSHRSRPENPELDPADYEGAGGS